QWNAVRNRRVDNQKVRCMQIEKPAPFISRSGADNRQFSGRERSDQKIDKNLLFVDDKDSGLSSHKAWGSIPRTKSEKAVKIRPENADERFMSRAIQADQQQQFVK